MYIQNNTFYFIKNLQESSVDASTFYINVIGELQDITQSVGFIAKITHKHVHNNHQSLKKNQSKELKDIQIKLSDICRKVSDLFNVCAFKEIPALNEEISILLKEIYPYIYLSLIFIIISFLLHLGIFLLIIE